VTKTDQAPKFDLDRYKILPATKGEQRIFDTRPLDGEPRTIFTAPPEVCQEMWEQVTYSGKCPMTALSRDLAMVYTLIVAGHGDRELALKTIRQAALSYDVKTYLLEEERKKTARLVAMCKEGDGE